MVNVYNRVVLEDFLCLEEYPRRNVSFEVTPRNSLLITTFNIQWKFILTMSPKGFTMLGKASKVYHGKLDKTW